MPTKGGALLRRVARTTTTSRARACGAFLGALGHGTLSEPDMEGVELMYSKGRPTRMELYGT